MKNNISKAVRIDVDKLRIAGNREAYLRDILKDIATQQSKRRDNN